MSKFHCPQARSLNNCLCFNVPFKPFKVRSRRCLFVTDTEYMYMVHFIVLSHWNITLQIISFLDTLIWQWVRLNQFLHVRNSCSLMRTLSLGGQNVINWSPVYDVFDGNVINRRPVPSHLTMSRFRLWRVYQIYGEYIRKCLRSRNGMSRFEKWLPPYQACDPGHSRISMDAVGS